MSYFCEPPLLDHSTLHHSERPIGPRFSVTGVMNLRTDVHSGGGDRGKKVAVVAVNSLGREKPRPNQSTMFLSIEGPYYTSVLVLTGDPY